MKYLKSYKIFESSEDDAVQLGHNKKIGDLTESNRYLTGLFDAQTLAECDSVVADIEDMLLDLNEAGLDTLVSYSPMTYTGRESSPKIVVDISADERLFASNLPQITDTTDRIKRLVKPLGFSTGEGTWTTDPRVVRQILIQK